MTQQISKNEQLVLQAYRLDPNCVNSDKNLIPTVWTIQGWDYDKSLYANFANVANPESITRARRSLHERGLIKYSKEAEEKRYEQYKEKTEEYSQGIPGFPKDPFEGFPKVEVDESTNTVRFI